MNPVCGDTGFIFVWDRQNRVESVECTFHMTQRSGCTTDSEYAYFKVIQNVLYGTILPPPPNSR